MGAAIGTVLISIGGFFGAGTAMNTEQQPPTAVAAQEKNEEQNAAEASNTPKETVTRYEVATPVTSTKAGTTDSDLGNLRSNVTSIYSSELKKLHTAVAMQNLMVDAVETTIADINDQITWMESYKMGAPDSADMMNSLIKISKTQLKYETSRLAYENSIKSWLARAEAYFIESSKSISTASRIELQTKIAEINEYLDNRDEAALSGKKWSDGSYKLQTQIDGYLAGLSNSYSSVPIVQVAPVYPTTYVPPTSFKCTSKIDFMGQVQTSCY